MGNAVPGKFFRHYLPTADQAGESRLLAWLGCTAGGQASSRLRQRKRFLNPRLWHLNRKSISGAVAVGLFIGWLPIPMQMLVAAIAASWLHVNLPVSVLLVWISNPLTFPALLYAAYHVGATLLGLPADVFAFQPTWAWLVVALRESWAPILVGSVFLGACSAVAGFLLTRAVWRIRVLQRLAARTPGKAN